MGQTKEGGLKFAAQYYKISVEEYLKKIETENYCNKCKTWQPKANFCKDASRATGLHKNCNPCKLKFKKRSNGVIGGPRVSRKGIPSGRKGIKFTGQALKNIQEGARRGAKKRIGKRRVYTKEGYANLVRASRRPKPHLRGENNARWKGGTGAQKTKDYFSPEYRQWRRAVFERDQYICRDCGYNKGKNLNAHHIKEYAKYIELRYEVSNGVTLCKICHEKRHFNPNSTRNIIKKKKGIPLKFKEDKIWENTPDKNIDHPMEQKE